MQTGLSTYYYNSALKYAKDGYLNRALELCAAAWGLSEESKQKNNKNNESEINIESEEPRKLAGLCYLALGNYSMADYCFNGLTYYTEDIQKSVKEKTEFTNSVSTLINDGQYRQAIKLLENCTDKSVSELNLLGCLYAVRRKKDKAVNCFLKALELNKDGSAVYIENAMKIKKWWFI